MMTEIFTVYDTAAVRYLEPFCAPTVEFAIRAFSEICMDEGHQFQKFPEDYNLFHVGSFNPETGEVTPITAHKIAQAINYVHGPGPRLEEQK